MEIAAVQMGANIEVVEVLGKTQIRESPTGQVKLPPADARSRRELLKLPSERILDVANALLYIHRRTHVQEYQDANWSVDPPPEES